jgi:biopolymer transport protein ExbB/TolQ
MKIALIMGVLLLATVAASAFWIERLGDQIGILKGNQLILESKLEEQNKDIKSHLTKQKQTQNQLLSLEKEKQEALRDVNKLRRTFANHDLDKLALAKPMLIQSRINKATKKVLENLEKLTDPNQFDEEDNSNS